MRFFLAPFVFIICYLVFPANNLFGQQRIRFKSFEVRSTGLHIKGNFFQLKENLISPLTYSGKGGQIDFFRLMEGEFGRNYFNFGLNLNYARNRFGLNVIYFKPEITVSHTRITGLAYNDKQNILIGLAISAKPRTYRFLDENNSHLNWVNSYTVDLHYILEQEIDNWRKFWIELQIPLVGVVFRPERDIFYSFQLPEAREIFKKIHSNPKFASLHNLQSATFKAFIDLSAGKTGALSIGYEADFATFFRPVRASVLSHSFTLRIMFNRFVL